MKANTKNKPLSFKPGEKARFYLERSGFLDGRTGRKKSKALNLNDFLNRAVVYAFEKERVGTPVLSGEDAKIQYLKFEQEQIVQEQERQAKETALRLRKITEELILIDPVTKADHLAQQKEEEEWKIRRDLQVLQTHS